MSNERFVTFPEIPIGTKNLLITGKWKNVFGVLEEAPNGKYTLPTSAGSKAFKNIISIVNYLKQKNILTLYCNKPTIEYFCRLFTILEDQHLFESSGIDDIFKYIHANSIVEDKEHVSQWFTKRENKSMKFDMIIQNPPYDKSLHLDFFNLGLNVLSENGKMIIIEPATWLINVRQNGKASLYNAIKQRIAGHVESVVIENLNNEFNTREYFPFSTVTVDMSKTFETIDFTCFGRKRQVKSLYDCNLIGDYGLICSILNKCKAFQHGNVMSNHLTKKKINGDFWYAKYSFILSGGFCGDEKRAFSDANYQTVSNGCFYVNYISCCYHVGKENVISKDPLCKKDSKGEIKENVIAGNIYGTKEELENWKYFVFNNKLPLFINICLTLDQNNTSKHYVPWLVDRKYTDNEINQIFGFTDEEISLIDLTLKKFERNSPWFKRYMFGKESVTDEEINTYLNGIASC